MPENIPRFVVLGDRGAWGDLHVGLAPAADGTLELARVPLVEGEPIVSDGPFNASASGLAVDRCGDVYISDTASHRLIAVDPVCHVRRIVPGRPVPAAPTFNSPCGLTLVRGRALYVADTGNRRVLMVDLPTLAPIGMLNGSFTTPTGLASDSSGRVYVLDSGARAIRRFGPDGAEDSAYQAKVAALAAAPAFLAVGHDDILYICDEASGLVHALAPEGVSLGILTGAPPGFVPGAVAAGGDRVYVADGHSGSILVFAAPQHAWIGDAVGYRAGVAALAIADDGALLVKPGGGEDVHRLPLDGFVTEGTLRSGRLDAGERSTWNAVRVVGASGAGAVALRVFTADTPAMLPDWSDPGTEAEGTAVLLTITSPPARRPRRYLWIEVTLRAAVHRRTGVGIREVRAATAPSTYLDYLPQIYRERDAVTGFLNAWLELFRAEFGAVELALDRMPRVFDPAVAPADFLPWLAGWVGFEPPEGVGSAQLRELLLDVVRLQERRGTPLGIREMVRLYTGVSVQIAEAFQERHVWQLGAPAASRLGFDTALAAALPDGMAVPGPVRPRTKFAGLIAEYYGDADFRHAVSTRVDPEVDFQSASQPPPPEPFASQRTFAVRWRGQVRSEYSETYTIYVVSSGGVRLWIDGQLVVENWTRHQVIENRGEIGLESGRWYSVALDYYVDGAPPAVRLLWSSQSQSKTIVPARSLYAADDDNVELTADPPRACDRFVVGASVVGQSDLIERQDVGEPLFSDAAHLFTVLVPAGDVRSTARLDALRRVLDAEKPAHTAYHLCAVGPLMRVGLQARVGVDAIIGGVNARPLGSATLGLDAVLDDTPETRVGVVLDAARIPAGTFPRHQDTPS